MTTTYTYTISQFLADTLPIRNFNVLRTLTESGYPNCSGDDYVKSGPQYIRRCLVLAANNLVDLVSAGMPMEARMERLEKFAFLGIDEKNQSTPEIENRENVLSLVNYLRSCEKLPD